MYPVNKEETFEFETVVIEKGCRMYPSHLGDNSVVLLILLQERSGYWWKIGTISVGSHSSGQVCLEQLKAKVGEEWFSGEVNDVNGNARHESEPPSLQNKFRSKTWSPIYLPKV